MTRIAAVKKKTWEDSNIDRARAFRKAKRQKERLECMTATLLAGLLANPSLVCLKSDVIEGQGIGRSLAGTLVKRARELALMVLQP